MLLFLCWHICVSLNSLMRVWFRCFDLPTGVRCFRRGCPSPQPIRPQCTINSHIVVQYTVVWRYAQWVNKWFNALTASTTAICGNGVVENGEECDCGWEDECREQCCYPQTASSDTASASSAAAGRPCTRRHGAECRSLWRLEICCFQYNVYINVYGVRFIYSFISLI